MDFDADGLCDLGDLDDDNDGVPDGEDLDPFNPSVCRDADGDSCDDCTSGTDDPANDGTDGDLDGLCDAGDLCPFDSLNDADADGICGDVDNCIGLPNADQADADADGLGDACDVCPGDPENDADADGICDDADNCPAVSNTDQADVDGNGIGDVCHYVAVAGQFYISVTEVTNAQYVELLNAVAESDPGELFNEDMQDDELGGIVRSGDDGSYSYATKLDMGNKPVNFVSWLDAARYANWLHHVKPVGPQGLETTETGAYDLTLGVAGIDTVRSSGATWFLPTRAEWDEAAYGDPTAGQPWLYPTRSDEQPTQATADAQGDISNPGFGVANYDKGAEWNDQDGNVTTVGSGGLASRSYWGTYDQGGNIAEWVEDSNDDKRQLRGGSFLDRSEKLRRSTTSQDNFSKETEKYGFRVATVAPAP